jgi:hypothetical protein
MSLMRPHRLRAPSGDGALLAEPSLDDAGKLLAGNAARLARWDYDFQGRRADRLRALARRQVVDQARQYLESYGLEEAASVPDVSAPLILTGHQPELFHPGVWVKNFAVAGLARAGGGLGLNLIVDHDVPKSTTLRVPQREGAAIRLHRLDFDDWAGEIPFEDLKVQNEAVFASLRDRVRPLLEASVPDPLIDDFWTRALRCRAATDRIGLRFALARRDLEASWGCRNLELPLSVVCETEGFLWFAAHLLAQLHRYQAVHNAALARYRTAYKIRSRRHPVPALRRQGDWLEAPFWIWRAGAARRRPLVVRSRAASLELRIDGDDQPFLELPLGPDREACCAVERLLTLPSRGIRLRTRALTTTMFARFLIGDLFVHGIGGAKYDELGDEIARDFLGIEPPGFLTLSTTLWLDLGSDPASLDQLHAVEQEIRDLTFNPDRHLIELLAAADREWVELKRRAVSGRVATRRERIARYFEIRRCNEALRPLVEAERQELIRLREQLLAGLQYNALAHDRQYSLVLHSERRLREAMSRVEALALGC